MNQKEWPINVGWLGDGEPQHKEVVYLLPKSIHLGLLPSIGEVLVCGPGSSSKYKAVVLGDVQYDQLHELNIPSSSEGEEWPGPIRDVRVETYAIPRSKVSDVLIRRLVELNESLSAARAKVKSLTDFFKDVLKDYGKKEP